VLISLVTVAFWIRRKYFAENGAGLGAAKEHA